MSPKKPEPTAEEVAALELVRLAREAGLSLTGPDGLLKQFTKTVLETALNEEMTEHLGHAQNWAPAERATCNVRNGIRPKTVLTEAPTRGVFWVTAAGRAGVRSLGQGSALLLNQVMVVVERGLRRRAPAIRRVAGLRCS